MHRLLENAVWIFTWGTVLSCIMSGRWLLNGEMNIFRALSSFNTVNIQAMGGWAIPKGLVEFFSAILTALSWNYPYLSSDWAIFIKMFLWVVSIGVIWALVEAATSAIQGIIGSVRSMIGA